MFCENCGAPLNDGTKFCPNCGAPVAGSAPATEPTSTSYAEPTYAQPAYNNSQATASGQPAKLYYPDPQRYKRFRGLQELAAMNRADDTNDFPDD